MQQEKDATRLRHKRVHQTPYPRHAHGEASNMHACIGPDACSGAVVEKRTAGKLQYKHSQRTPRRQHQTLILDRGLLFSVDVGKEMMLERFQRRRGGLDTHVSLYTFVKIQDAYMESRPRRRCSDHVQDSVILRYRRGFDARAARYRCSEVAANVLHRGLFCRCGGRGNVERLEQGERVNGHARHLVNTQRNTGQLHAIVSVDAVVKDRIAARAQYKRRLDYRRPCYSVHVQQKDTRMAIIDQDGVSRHITV